MDGVIALLVAFVLVPCLQLETPEESGGAVEEVLDLVCDDSCEPVLLSGKVSLESGEPAPHSVVTLHLTNRGAAESHEVKVTTNKRGVFRTRIRIGRGILAATPISAESADGRQIGAFRFPTDTPVPVQSSIEIELVQPRTVNVHVVDGANAPVPDAKVVLCTFWPFAPRTTTTNREGVATFTIPSNDRVEHVAALKRELGLDYRSFTLSREEQAAGTNEPPEFPLSNEVTLKLDGASPFKVRVIDENNMALPGIELFPWSVKKESEPEELIPRIFGPASRVITNADGIAEFTWFPNWQRTRTAIYLHSDFYESAPTSFEPSNGDIMLEIRPIRLVPIRGTVRHSDGRPAGNIRVTADCAGFVTHRITRETLTNVDGTYELLVSPDLIYLVVAAGTDGTGERLAAAPQTGFAVHKDTPVERLDFMLRAATQVSGVMVNKADGMPVANTFIYVSQFGTALSKLKGVNIPNPQRIRMDVIPQAFFGAVTDESGRFEVYVGDGRFAIHLPDNGPEKEFIVNGESHLDFELTADISRPMEFSGRVTSEATEMPIDNATVEGVPHNFTSRKWKTKTDAEGKFVANRGSESTVIRVLSDDQQLGSVVADVGDAKTTEVQLKATGKVTGRLVDSTTNEPCAGQKLNWGIEVRTGKDSAIVVFGGNVTTGDDGSFVLAPVLPNVEYRIELVLQKKQSG